MKELGKITKVTYGLGGYQDAQLGLSVVFEGKGWGVSDFWGFWASKPSKGAQWTVEDQVRHHGETANKIRDVLKKAKVNDVASLKGIPVEVTFENRMLSSWRVLEEVL